MPSSPVAAHQDALYDRLRATAGTLPSDPVADAADFRRRWKLAAAGGLTSLIVPGEYGGLGLNARQCCSALEALGYGSEDAGFNFALSAHLLAGVIPLVKYGSEAQRAAYLPAIVRGECIVANAMTEASAGSDVFAMAATATPVDNGFSLAGRKTYCSNGPVADLMITYALSNPEKGFFGGVSAFALAQEDGHFLSGPVLPKNGLHSCLLSEVVLEGRVGRERLLGEPGAGGRIFNTSMCWERICLGAVHLGEMERLLAGAIRFARKRKSGGRAIAGYQSVAHPLADLRCRMTAARYLQRAAADRIDAGEDVMMDAAMVKLTISELYRDFALQLHQLYAGAAFKQDAPVSRCVQDALAATLYSGTSEVQRNLIARYMGLK